MAVITLNILGWNHAPELVCGCIDAVLAQTFSNFELVFTDNASQNELVEQIREKYRDCNKLKFVVNTVNTGYAGGHNRFIAESITEFVMVLNPDALLDRDFLTNILKVFTDPKVAAATGKMVKPEKTSDAHWVLDGTGIMMTKARVAKERGQLEIDCGQYDNSTEIFGVSGTAAVYRRAALAEAELSPGEYFDKDFFAYSEDWDLSWRLRLLGYSIRYVPQAVVYHKRVVGQIKWSLANPLKYVLGHRQFSDRRRLGWRNRILAIAKNDFGAPFWKALPLLLGREIAAFFYLLVFETRNLAILPSLFKLLPKMIRKRKTIQRKRRITFEEIGRWF